MRYKITFSYDSQNYPEQSEPSKIKEASQEAEEVLASMLERSVRSKGMVVSSITSGSSSSLSVKVNQIDITRELLEALKKHLTENKHFKSVSFKIEVSE